MFSRFTKFFVKNLRHGKHYGCDENMKITFSGTTRQIHKTLSGCLKNGTRLRAATCNPSRLRSSRLLIAKSEKSRSTTFSGSGNSVVSRIDKLSQMRFPMKNRILSQFQNRELDVERTLIESRDKEFECSIATASMKNKTNTSEQRSITKFPLLEPKVTGLMGVLTQLPNTATDSSPLPSRQLPPSQSDKLPSQLLDLDGRFSGNEELTNLSGESSSAIRKLASDTPNRNQNDDYYPQGDEYEEDIGVNNYGQSMTEPKQSPKSRGQRKAPKLDEDYDNFSIDLLSTMGILSEPTSIVLSKNPAEKDTLERLQALIDKAAEFKKRIFGASPPYPSSKKEEEKESKIEQSKGNKNEDSKIDQSRSSREDQMAAHIMWLGDTDCGEGLPDRPLRGPCHPPDGPCVPVKEPGYPAKPRSQKKDFCFECPPKKPCNLNQCPPETDGTCGKAINQTVDVLNLHSESQAANDNVPHMILGISATRLLGRPISSRNFHHLHRPNSHLQLPCRSFSKSQACGKTNEEAGCKKGSKKVAQAPASSQEPLKTIRPQKVVPKVLYRKCPPPPKLPKLPKSVEPPKSKTAESCVKISAPKCPPLPSLPKCPKCPPCKSTEPPPASDSPCTKTKQEEKKHIWQRLGECTKRKMSTYVRPALYYEDKMLFTSHRSTKRFSTSTIVIARFSSKSDSPPTRPPWKWNKCKTVEEVVGEKVDEKIEQLECKAMNCSRNPNAECYPETPRCAEVRKPVEEKSDKSRDSGSKSKVKSAKSSGLKKPIEKIDYSKTKCEPPRLMELGPCPTPPLSSREKHDRKSGAFGKGVPLPMPKPPSAPVVLCTCRPPPKLHPGSCPRYVEPEKFKPQPQTNPCPKKQDKCPEIGVVYCPPDLGNKNERAKQCKSKKSSKT